MDKESALRYCELMKEVKYRVSAIKRILDGHCTLGFLPVNAEVVYLQFRKILELIAYGSLVANFKVYSSARKDHLSEWHASRFLRKIEALNPAFYPEPMAQKEGYLPYTNLDLFTGNYLTRSEFETLYDICGGFMHSENPYGDPHRYEELLQQSYGWLEKIVNLLNLHIVTFADGEEGCLILMGGGEEVSFATFGPPVQK